MSQNEDTAVFTELRPRIADLEAQMGRIWQHIRKKVASRDAEIERLRGWFEYIAELEGQAEMTDAIFAEIVLKIAGEETSGSRDTASADKTDASCG